MTDTTDGATKPESGPEAALRGLHPAVKTVWRISGAITGVVLGTVLSIALFAVSRATGPWPLHPLLAGPLVSAGLIVLLIFYAGRRHAHWRYALREEEVLASYGVVFKVRRSLPRVRVQHVDIHSGPIDRALGIVHVALHAAGSSGPVLTIPGLAPAEAEALRDALLASAAGR